MELNIERSNYAQSHWANVGCHTNHDANNISDRQFISFARKLQLSPTNMGQRGV